MIMNIYLIGGETYSKDLYDYFKRTAQYLRACGHQVCLPILYPEGGADPSTISEINFLHRKLITEADTVYSDFSTFGIPSISKTMELYMAYSKDKRIIISGNPYGRNINGRDDNAFLREANTIIFKTHDAAMLYFWKAGE